MTIVFKHVKNKFDLFFSIFRVRAETMTSAKFSLESGDGDSGVLAGLRLYAYISIGRFSVNLSRDGPVLMSSDQNIKEGDRSIDFFFAGKLNPRVNGIQAFLELGCRVTGRSFITAAWPNGRISDGGPTIIDIDLDVARDNTPTPFGYFDSLVNRVGHPDLTHSHHEGQANGTRIISCMMSISISEVR